MPILRNLLRDYLIPPGVASWIRTLRGNVGTESATAEGRALMRRNARLNGKYAGRRCFVIGNGPSLRTLDLACLKGELTVTMNWFNRHEILGTWQPTFHCVAEPRLDDERSLQDLVAGLSPEGFVFMTSLYPAFERQQLLGLPLHFVHTHGPATPDREIDLAHTLPDAPDTSVLGVMLAIALGCSPIYVLGVDYDLLSYRGTRKHFYAEDAHEVEDYRQRSYLRLIEQAHTSFSAHHALNEIASRRGQHIFNLSAASFLDAYPFQEWDEIRGAPAVPSWRSERPARI